jgi:hypothetical protein
MAVDDLQPVPVVRPEAPSPAARPVADEEPLEAPTLFDYLQTPEGHGIAKRVLDIIDELRKAKVAQDATVVRYEKWLQIAIVIAVVGASTVLAVVDKFTPTIGVLFGALIGYVFGKRAR